MSRPRVQSSVRQGCLMALVIALTLAFAAWIMAYAKGRSREPYVPGWVSQQREHLEPGVILRVRSARGEMDHVLHSGVVDAAVLHKLGIGADGPLDATVIIRFDPDQVRWATLGAVIRNGSVIVMKDGDLVISDAAGDEERLVMSVMPVSFTPRVHEVQYIVAAKRAGMFACRALWQPEDRSTPQPLPPP